MSGLVKGVGKVFKAVGKVVKKVAKVVIKIAPYALAAAAVVMTGGAALGIMPTFAAGVSSVVGGLGLSAGLSTALSGAVVGAGFGAAAGGLIGGKKGMMQGMLMGGLAGGLMPAAMPGMGTVLKGGASALAPGSALSNTIGGLADAPTGLMPGSALSNSINGLGATATAGTSAATAAAAPVASAATGATTAAGSGGLGGLLGSNPLLASQLIGGVSQAFAPNEYKEAAEARGDEERSMGYWAYGGGDWNGKEKGGLIPGVYSQNADPFGVKSWGPPPAISPSNYYTPPPKRWAFNPVTNSVEEVGA